MYKVVMNFPDGTTEEMDEVFETEAEARSYGEVCCGNYVTGVEVLHMSNPGDYPPLNEDDEDVGFDVIEVDESVDGPAAT
jgi:hypothetical protein